MHAQVMRRGQHWLVMLVDSSDATAEKAQRGLWADGAQFKARGVHP